MIETQKTDEKQIKVKVRAGNSFWMALVVILIFFEGDPDLCDALIHWLMK